MYETWHPHCDHPQRVRARVNYVVWSDVFTCPDCGEKVTFWDMAVDRDTWQVKDAFLCPACHSELTKKKLDRVFETRLDHELGQTIRAAKQLPVLIHYVASKKRYLKSPDSFDRALIEQIEEHAIPYRVPTDRLPEGEKTVDPTNVGVTHVHHFYTRRNLWSLAAYAHKLGETRGYVNVSSVATVITKMYRFRSQNEKLGRWRGTCEYGTLYVPSLTK